MRRLLTLAYRISRSNVTELRVPYRLTYAVTSRCQAHCVMCDIWKKPADNEMTVAEIDRTFAGASRFSWINLTGGELFQRPDIREVMRTVIRRSSDLYLLNFPTNGQQTDDIVATVDDILQNTSLPRLMVSVSIDGPRDLHDSIRNLPGLWDRALKTFKALRERTSRRFSVFLGYTLQQVNMEAFDETMAACRAELGTLSAEEFHVNIAHISGHYYGNTAFTGIPDGRRMSEALDRIGENRHWSRWNPVHVIERGYQRYSRQYLLSGRVPVTCQAANASCFIDPTGIVYPCSGFDLPLGSLREQDYNLYRIWQNDARLRIRDKVRHGDCPHCWTPCEAYQSLLADLIRTTGKPS